MLFSVHDKRMKHTTLLAAFLIGTVFAAFAQSPYETYYENLPLEIEHVKPVVFPDTTINLKSYLKRFNVVPGTDVLATEAIQTAIDELAAAGGGHLVIPRGTWKTGPLTLKSNIDLHLSKGAVILFTEDKSLYVLPDKKGNVPTKARPCIAASKAENIGITGQGVIDGQGFFWRPIKYKKIMKGSEEDQAMWEHAKSLGGRCVPNGKDTLWYPFNLKKDLNIPNIASSPEEQEKMRYHLVNITDSKNVLIEGVTLRNSPKFHLVPARIQNLIIDGVTVDCPWWAQNGDAMDIGNTQVCLVVNCKINCGDDGICMKGGVGADGVKRGPNRDFLIRQDTVYRAHGGFVIGSEFSGGMQRMIVKDCVFDGTDIGLRFKSAPGRGGWCESIICEDIIMKNILEDAIFFEAGYADRAVGRSATDSDNKEAYFPDWGNFTFRNITAVNVRNFVNASGMKGFPIHDCTFSNIHIYGLIREPLRLTHCTKFTFTDCSYSGGTKNFIDKTCSEIIYNGKPAE